MKIKYFISYGNNSEVYIQFLRLALANSWFFRRKVRYDLTVGLLPLAMPCKHKYKMSCLKVLYVKITDQKWLLIPVACTLHGSKSVGTIRSIEGRLR